MVTAMFAHMLRLIIQNRFHLLLKYFSIRNSLSDVPSAPLFVDAVSIFVACAAEFQVGVLAAPEDFSVSNLPPARIDNSAFLCFLFCLHVKWLEIH